VRLRTDADPERGLRIRVAQKGTGNDSGCNGSARSRSLKMYTRGFEGRMEVQLGAPSNSGTSTIGSPIEIGLSLEPVPLYCRGLDESFESTKRGLLRGNGNRVEECLRKG